MVAERRRVKMGEIFDHLAQGIAEFSIPSDSEIVVNLSENLKRPFMPLFIEL